MASSSVFDRVRERDLTRRAFAGVALAAATSLALSGCSEEGGDENTLVEGDAPVETGEWIPLACQCGTCVNMGYVVDGIVVRQKTDDRGDDSFENPQCRGCARGRLSRQWYLGADRLKYPMKRRNWQPGGENINGHLRGIDEWERISWDDALDMIASETKRIMDTYGPKSFFCGVSGDGHGGGAAGGWVTRLLNVLGGCVYVWGTQSYGGIPIVANNMQGPWNFGMNDTLEVFGSCKAETAIVFGMGAGAVPNNYWRRVKQGGVKIIVVDPYFSYQSQQVADRWIPVRPGTDGALLLGIAHHMIANNLQDQEFLDTYTIGFDAEHMPEGASAEDNFKDYVLGTYDGLPKTPQWASEICGVPADDIVFLAEEAASASPLIWLSTQAPARTDNGQEFTQLFLSVGWMTGNVGIPGGEVSISHPMMMGTTFMCAGGPTGVQIAPNPVCEPPAEAAQLPWGVYDPEKFYGLPYGHAWDAIVTGKYTDFVHGERDIDIRCIWKTNICSPLNQFSGGMRGIEAFRKVDFVLTSDIFMSTDCMYSDIVLPAVTHWEKPFGSTAMGNFLHGNLLLFGKQVCEPIYEAHDDVWMEVEIGKRLGIDPAQIQNVSMKQAGYNVIAGSQVMKEDFSGMEPLVSITQEDIESLGVEGQPQEGKIPIMEMLDQGYYVVQRKQDDPMTVSPRAAFRSDPVANPAPTASGKLEIYCKPLADYMKYFGTSPVVEATPKYRAANEGYEASFDDWENKVKGEFPFQLYSTHHIRQVHSVFANNKQVNECHPNNLLINVKDAQALGLSQDETVLVTSKHGKMLRRVNITPRIMMGTLMIGEGNWRDLDEESGIDFGGNANTLAGGHLIAAGHQPWNTCLAKVEKWTGEPLQPDCLRPQRIFDFE